MTAITDTKRNRSAEKGESNNPDLRDKDGTQPDTSTISSSENDEANQHLTRTASDDFREEKNIDKKADKKFDE